MLQNQNIDQVDLKICSRCIYDERVPSIHFDEQQVCNYCRQVEGLIGQYGTAKSSGEMQLTSILDDIRRVGQGKPYDCIVGVSGGTDSSYLLYLCNNLYKYD